MIGAASLVPISIGPVASAAPAQLKPGPSGIVCLMKTDMLNDRVKDLASDPCWTNPNVTAVMLRSHWNVVEPSEGQFNFAHFDEGLSLARKYGKRLGMSIAAGTITPDWVYGAAAVRFSFSKKSHMGSAIPEFMPEPWDPVFQKKWSVLLHEFGRRYDTAPELAYVTMGGAGRQIETFFVDSPEDIEKFNSDGGPENWARGAQAVAKMYAESFPHTHFLYAIGPPTPTPGGRQTLSAMLDACGAAYPGWFGVRCDGLRPNFGPRDPAGQIIQKFASTTTAGFQMSLPSKGGQTMGGGTLQEALTNGVGFGAQFVEVYRGDCADPNQQATLQAANARLQANTQGR